jgi:hypothetical protein
MTPADCSRILITAPKAEQDDPVLGIPVIMIAGGVPHMKGDMIAIGGIKADDGSDQFTAGGGSINPLHAK